MGLGNLKKIKIPTTRPSGLKNVDTFFDDPVRPNQPARPYKPDYSPVIAALKQLTRAFETLQNGGVPPKPVVSDEERKKRSERAKHRWASMSPEERKAKTAKARASRRKDL